MALALKVLVGDDPQEPIDGIYQVAGGVRVTLRAKPDSDAAKVTAPGWFLDGKAWTTGAGIEDDTTSLPSRTFSPDGKYGKEITLRAKVDGLDTSAPPITLGKPPDAPNGLDESPADGVSEVAVGEYDPRFSLVAGGVLVLVLVAIGAAGWQISGSLLPLSNPLPVPTGAAPSSVPPLDPTTHVASRTASLVRVMTAFAGIFILAIGAYLAALETRGRLRATAQPGKIRGTLAELVNFIEPLRRLRGTTAAFAVGLLLVLASLLAPTSSSMLPDPAASSTPTATGSSPTPTTSPAPSTSSSPHG
ncbi:MAG: hypothetical protein QM619_09690 [Micropruina sp.]|uniref:hypothetical protein n=1 Tax=Micropruina sp. TaxID=2737536 RepID=UPI0039E38DE3